MIYTIATKRGIGIELWGTGDDLRSLYEVVGSFWNSEKFQQIKGFDNRDELISSFSYEIRHAYQGDRLKRESSHFSLDPINHFGAEFSWVHILFSLAALKYNMQFIQHNKLDLAMFLQLEFWLEKSMEDFDSEGAKALKPFLDGALYSANEYLYQYMRSINADYFLLGGGKTAFRKLPKLLRRAVYSTDAYNEYLVFLTKEAQRLQCEISDLELSDEQIDYDRIKW